MIRRIWTAYRVEVMKAVRQRFTYLGPLLLGLALVCLPAVRPLAEDGHSDYLFVAYAASVDLSLLGLLVVLIYCAAMVSSELGSGVIRTVLVRSVRRTDFIAAKLLLGCSYASFLTILVAAGAWTIGMVFGEFEGVIYGGEMRFTNSQMTADFAVSVLLSLLPQWAAVSYAVMVSTMTRSSGMAIGATVGTWLVADMLKYPLGVAPFVFTTYMSEPWRVFADRASGLQASWWPGAAQCAAVSVVSLAVFATLAMVILGRRSLRL